jgi:hypothetical protein
MKGRVTPNNEVVGKVMTNSEVVGQRATAPSNYVVVERTMTSI